MKKLTTKDPVSKEPKTEPAAVARLHALVSLLLRPPPRPVSIAGPSGYFTPLSAERGQQASKRKTDSRKQKRNKNEDIP